MPPLEHPLEEGWTLPASWYSDETVASRERERIFVRSWQYAGPAEHVAEPGSFTATQAGHIPVVVTRDREGTLRAFVNVCRHRAYMIAQGNGCRETLQCAYHAWTYELDGGRCAGRRARSARPGSTGQTSRSSRSRSTRGAPSLFVNPDAEAAPLAETLGDLPQIVASSGLDLATLTFHSHTSWEIEANWKVALENYLSATTARRPTPTSAR